MNSITRLLGFIERHQRRLASNLETALQDGDVEAIHRLRVASRRLNEPLQIAAEWLPARKIKRIRRTTRTLRRAFRNVRDLDVLAIGLTCERTAPSMSAHDLAHLEGLVTTRRQRAFNKARKRVATDAGTEVDRQLTRLTARFGETVSQPRRLREQLAEFWQQRYDALMTTFPKNEPNADLHPSRLCLKRLRYITELLYAVDERKKDQVLDALGSMQDLLGNWNDDVFAVNALSSLATEPGLLSANPGWAAAVLEYAGHRARLGAEGQQATHRAWPTLVHTLAAARIAHATLADPTTTN